MIISEPLSFSKALPATVPEYGHHPQPSQLYSDTRGSDAITSQRNADCVAQYTTGTHEGLPLPDSCPLGGVTNNSSLLTRPDVFTSGTPQNSEMTGPYPAVWSSMQCPHPGHV